MWRPVLHTLTVLATALWPLLAAADGEAVVSRGDGSRRATIEFSDRAIRLQTAALGSNYLLLRDGQAYLVSGNQALSVDGVLDSLLGRAEQHPMERYQAIVDTGRHERVAGLDGRVYLLKFRDQQDRPRQAEAVLSNDPTTRELTRALQRLGRGFAARKLRNPVFDYGETLAAAIGPRGVLRYGSDYRLQSVAPRQFAPGHFELPSAPADLSGLGQMAPLLNGLLGSPSPR